MLITSSPNPTFMIELNWFILNIFLRIDVLKKISIKKGDRKYKLKFIFFFFFTDIHIFRSTNQLFFNGRKKRENEMKKCIHGHLTLSQCLNLHKHA